MLTQGFGPDIEKLVSSLVVSSKKSDREVKAKKTPSQFLLVSATITPALRRLLKGGSLPEATFVETRDLHKPLSSMKHHMLETKGRDKISLLLNELQCRKDDGHQISKGIQSSIKSRPTQLVFCNSVSSCRAVEHSLREAGLDSRWVVVMILISGLV